MANKGGRPTKVPGGLRRVLQIRLTDAERAEYQKAAERAGLSLSEWIRSCLGKAARRG
jgi:antitoxin component of RelBE/YafQ-DinJ toxin-antitoxin module